MSTTPNTHPAYTIIDGGDRFHLRTQLDDIGRVPSADRPYFPLTIVPNPTMFPGLHARPIKVHIRGMEAEDGSGTSWMIAGYVGHVDDRAASEWGTSAPRVGAFFRGVYSTRRRKGSLSITEG